MSFQTWSLLYFLISLHLSFVEREKIYQALSNHPKVKEDEKRLNEIAPDYNDPLHVFEIITIKKQNS